MQGPCAIGVIGMASNEQQQQWAIASRAKQQIRQNKRRERAQRLHMQVLYLASLNPISCLTLNLFSLQAQQRECAEPNSQGSPGGIQHSHSIGSRIPAFSSPLCQAGSNEDDDDDGEEEEEEDEDEEENEAPTNSLRDQDNQIHVKQQQSARSKGGGGGGGGGGDVGNNKEAEPLYEEDVIDGFAIISFASYEDLEVTFNVNSNQGS